MLVTRCLWLFRSFIEEVLKGRSGLKQNSGIFLSRGQEVLADSGQDIHVRRYLPVLDMLLHGLLALLARNLRH